MAVRVVAVDDEPGILCLLESIINSIRYAQLVGSAQNASGALDLVKVNNPDVVFLDIDLPDMNGIELAEKLKEYDPNLYIVFISAHSEFSLDAYRLYAYDYIIKPIDENRLKTTIRRIQQMIKPFTKDCSAPGSRLTLHDEDEIILVDPETIYYVEKISRKAVIHTVNGIFNSTETLHELEERLGDNFFRSHKSYFVNISRIERILASERVSSYHIKFKNYPYEALLSRNRIGSLLKKIKS